MITFLNNIVREKARACDAGAINAMLKIINKYIDDSDLCMVECSVLSRIMDNRNSIPF